MDHLSLCADRPAARPAVPKALLQGRTLLLVEDSRLCCEAVRLMFRGSGGRLRRADSLASARRHMALYMPDCVMVDLGLPDGSGLDLITELRTLSADTPLIIAISGQPEYEAAARRAGAARFLAKPFASPMAFQAALMPLFFADFSHCGPDRCRDTTPALRDDLYLAVDLLKDGPHGTNREYCLQFIATLARSLDDCTLAQAVERARDAQSLYALTRLVRARLRALPLI